MTGWDRIRVSRLRLGSESSSRTVHLGRVCPNTLPTIRSAAMIETPISLLDSRPIDKASVLDEVIEYLKQLQTQVTMMSSFPHMMMSMTTMRQLQMSMMAQMGMGAMDINSINRLGPAASVPPMVHHPATLLPLTVPWDGSVVRLHPSATGVLPDAFSNFFDCQTMVKPHPPQQQQQPISLDAYNRMTALYKQAQQPTTPSGKSGLL